MDFELSDWAVDSNILKLDRQLFSEKNQLTVPDVQQKIKKDRKRKGIQEKDQSRKKIKIESESTIQGEKSVRELKRDKRREKLKKLKEKKLMRNDLFSQEQDVEGKTDRNIKKCKTKTKNNINELGLAPGKNVEEKRNEGKEKGNNKIGMISESTNNTEGEKRKKQKKASSKRNKYKHLDEARKAHCGGEVKDFSDQNISLSKAQTDSKSCKKTDASPVGEKLQETIKKKQKKKSKLNSSPGNTNLNDGSETDLKNNIQNFKSAVDGKGKYFLEKGKKQLNISKLRRILDDKDKSKEPDQVQSTDKKNKGKPVSLRDKMMGQLKSARFRYINEQLYTQTGSEAAILFKDDEEAFQCYHEGFQNQVDKWPTNPVNIIINQIKAGSDTAVVGDFGCGDAKIARSVRNKVYSFDLVALNDHVTVCNIEKVPLQDNTLDIGVFCLSLMGTNLVEYLLEANRVIKTGGILIIAEVTSRIQKIGKFIRNIEALGFEVVKKDTRNSVFIMVTFRKKGRLKEDIPDIQLEPCIYKRR